MNDLSAYEKLGVSEDASFDEIQEAKKKLSLKYQNDVQVVETIEQAYDTIIMQRLKMRQEGKIKVPDQIRFPEKTESVKIATPTKNLKNLTNQSSNCLNNFIDSPSSRDITISTIIFLILATITVFNPNNNNLSLLLTTGVAVSFYFLYQKERLFWRSAAIILVSFLSGIFLGSILANTIVSSGFNLSINSDQFATIFTFFCFWFSSSFFR